MAILKAVLNLLRVQYNGAGYLVINRGTVSHLGPREYERRRNIDARSSSGAERVSGVPGNGDVGRQSEQGNGGTQCQHQRDSLAKF